MSTWDTIVDAANIVTAISAVVAIIVASWLSLKAIRVAREDNDRASEEFLYSKVDDVLESSLEVTAEARELAHSDDPEFRFDSLKAFKTRIRTLVALGGVESSKQVEELFVWGDFIDSLTRICIEFERDGHSCLVETLVEGRNDNEMYILETLANRYHGEPSYIYGMITYELQETAFQPGEKYAAHLKKLLADENTTFDSAITVRVFFPWLLHKFKWMVRDNELLWSIEDIDTGFLQIYPTGEVEEHGMIFIEGGLEQEYIDPPSTHPWLFDQIEKHRMGFDSWINCGFGPYGDGDPPFAPTDGSFPFELSPKKWLSEIHEGAIDQFHECVIDFAAAVKQGIEKEELDSK